MSWEKEQVPAGQMGVSDKETEYFPYEMYPQAADDSWSYGDPDKVMHSFSGTDGNVEYTARDFAPMWRWRDAYTNDFKARMDWCVADYAQANHNPVAVFMGDKNRTVCRLRADAGETFSLDASGSYDPDLDSLIFKWCVYPESGTYKKEVVIQKADESVAEVTIPKDAGGLQIHIILEVVDDSSMAPLSSYRRIVVDVNESFRKELKENK
jgi:hypothetical protein